MTQHKIDTNNILNAGKIVDVDYSATFVINKLKMNNKHLLLAFGIMITTLVQAQRPATYDAEESKQSGFSTNRIFVGGSINLGFSSYSFQAGAVPEIGYSITDWLDAGLGINLNYSSERADYYYNGNVRYRNFNYGGGPFVRIYPIRFLFVQTQFEHNWLKQNAKDMNTGYEYKATYGSNSFIAGIGYTQRIVGQSSFYTMIGLDLLTDKNSPYRDYNGSAYPIIRAGFNFYLKPSKR
ncbi:hypothetical protein FRZ67_10825 [Panacibacter ginsenosidivorans]|uniref:Outer membrane protein beta-barrel domain-containing protein n=1 Tax=Panacibacter ginsenosidivorans TaxID=1813871 RepID=A0A5B8V9E6_9BACT|nr:hypothetical protein [Panacibacter ginsenosidivorans]QEC67765.1 hypothetical protein FRZ67_10825 [Panacibacter ginsenosidivorans]